MRSKYRNSGPESYFWTLRVQRAKTLDNDYETLQRLIEPPPARRPVGSEMALAPVNSAATQPDEVDS